MLDVAVIADDLTGAADCGITFAAAGLSTFVAFAEAAAPEGIEALSVDTDSRREVEAEAVRRARAAAERVLAEGARALYRKIDSTLRGHVGPEIAETLRAVGATGGRFPIALLAPAFPGTGRTTVGGDVLVKGVLLERTEVWRDARMSVSPRPSELLQQAGLRARVIPLAQVRAGTDALAREVERRAATGADALVFDAETEDDLAAVARAGARLTRPVVWSGSAGLARYLPATTRLSLEPHALLAGPSDPRWPATDLARALATGNDVVLVLGEEPLGAERGPALAAAAARLVVPHAGGLCGIVATGGDVARAVLAALGATGLRLEGEIEPGVPLGVADSAPPLPVVTKAGAFGDAQTLSRARAALRPAGRRG